MDFVIPGKDESLVSAYKAWESRAVPKINCDVAFHMAVTYYSEAMVEEMAELTNEYGVNSYAINGPSRPCAGAEEGSGRHRELHNRQIPQMRLMHLKTDHAILKLSSQYYPRWDEGNILKIFIGKLCATIF